MKKIMKNKKGFTLIELLAVIVLLAIVGVVGANLIITRLNKGKVDTFVNDYQDIVKEVSAAQIEGMDDCDDITTGSTKKCSDSKQIDYASSDISLKITYVESNMKTEIVAKAKGTFAKIDLNKYYCENDSTASNTKACGYKDANNKTPNAKKKSLPKNAKITDGTTITGTFE